MSKQEYLFNYKYVTIEHDVEGSEELVVVLTDREEYLVARRDNLIPKEESWGYKRELERKEELERLAKAAQDNFNLISDRILNDAIKSISFRMKFNAFFGVGGQGASLVPMITEALEELITKEGKDKVKSETEKVIDEKNNITPVR